MDTRDSGEQGDQQVHEVGVRACHDLGRNLPEGREPGGKGRDDNRFDDTQGYVPCRLLADVPVGRGQREPAGKNRSHERRNQHRSDDYGRAVQEQAEKRDQ